MKKLLKTQKEITVWLDHNDVENYILNPDKNYGFVVDVEESVDLSRQGLSSIDVKFNHVNGDFNCGFNKLRSLRGCPTSVSRSFCFDYNQISSLDFCPQNVGADFYGRFNAIKSLEFCPPNIEGLIFLNHNPALGAVQKINDFKEIYQLHLEIVNIKQEQKMLDGALECTKKLSTSHHKI